MVNRYLTDVLTSTPACDVIQKCIMNTWNLDRSFFIYLYFNGRNFKRQVQSLHFHWCATVQSHLNVPDCKVFNFYNVWPYLSYLYDMLLSILVVMSNELRRLGRK